MGTESKLQMSAMRLAQILTLRLPRRRGAGKVTAWIASWFSPPPRTMMTVRWAGQTFRLDVSQSQERFMCLSPQLYEYRVGLALRRCLKPGDTFVDIGANVGLFTVLAADLVGKNGKVLAIEPDPETFEKLRWNVERNELRQVILLNMAVSDMPGTATLYRNVSGNAGENTLVQDHDRDTVPVTVTTATLDQMLDAAGLEAVNTIKLDIEGWEIPAVRHSRVLVQDPRPKIIAEIDDDLQRRAGYSAREMTQLFLESGFTEEIIGRRDRLFS